MSYNFADLEEITQEEYDILESNFNRLANGLSRFGWVNENKTVITFYAYGLTRGTTRDDEAALNLNGEWDVRCEFNGGHDVGTYGTIRKKALKIPKQNKPMTTTVNGILCEVVRIARVEYEDQRIVDPEGMVNVSITSKNGTVIRRYDMRYGFLDDKLLVSDVSHPQATMSDCEGDK